jgi:tetratricopeptide (TPR) repeat protein
MSNHPSRSLPFYITVILFFLITPCFSAELKLTGLQKQARIYRIQGYALQKEGNLDGALSYYQKALYLDPYYVVIYNDTGILYESLGDTERAKEMYLKAIEIEPSYPNSYSNLALIYEGEKDYVRATAYWRKRSVLGDQNDPWTQIARKHMGGDIASAVPQSYPDIKEQYQANIQQLAEEVPVLGRSGHLTTQGKKEATLLNIKKASSETARPSQSQSNKGRAEDYLKRARNNFSKGEYVTALKEATVAEYLNPANSEINEFVDKIRKKLLE